MSLERLVKASLLLSALSFSLYACSPVEPASGETSGVTQVQQALAPPDIARPREDWQAANPVQQSAAMVPRFVTFHTTVTPNDDLLTPEERLRSIQGGHMGPSFGAHDIGYHFIIDAEGTVWQGADELVVGAHARGTPPNAPVIDHNPDNVGVAFLGCHAPGSCGHVGGAERPSDLAINSAIRLLRWLHREYGIVLDRQHVKGHREWPHVYKACPGDFVLNEIDQIVEEARCGERDLPEWACNAINDLSADYPDVLGRDCQAFRDRPQCGFSRAEWAKMLGAAINLDDHPLFSECQSVHDDIDLSPDAPGSWYTRHVACGAALIYANDDEREPIWASGRDEDIGSDHTRFDGGRYLSKCEGAKTLAEAFNVAVDSSVRLSVDDLPAFNDSNQIPVWCRPYVVAGVEAGYLAGPRDGVEPDESPRNFNPNRLMTVGEAASMMLGVLQSPDLPVPQIENRDFNFAPSDVLVGYQPEPGRAASSHAHYEQVMQAFGFEVQPEHRQLADGAITRPLGGRAVQGFRVLGDPVADGLVNGGKLPHDGIEFTFEAGVATGGQATTAALFCGVDDAPLERKVGFQSGEGLARIGDLPPGQTFTCLVRTRFRGDPDVWDDSEPFTWVIDDRLPAARIVSADVDADSLQGCDDLLIDVTVENPSQVRLELNSLRVAFVPTGAQPDGHDVFAARPQHVTLEPGERRTYIFRLDRGLQPLNPGAEEWEILVEVIDEHREIAEPVELRVRPRPVDEEPPELRMRLLARGPDSNEVLGGEPHLLQLTLEDDHAIAQVEVDWSIDGVEWTPIEMDAPNGRECPDHRFLTAEWVPDAMWPARTEGTIRARAVDMAGRMTTVTQDFIVLDNRAPSARFLEPSEGAVYRLSDPCVPVRAVLQPGTPLVDVEWVWAIGDQVLSFVEDAEVGPAGVIEACLRIRGRVLGDRVSPSLEVTDENGVETVLNGPEIVILPSRPDDGWSELTRLEFDPDADWNCSGGRATSNSFEVKASQAGRTVLAGFLQKEHRNNRGERLRCIELQEISFNDVLGDFQKTAISPTIEEARDVSWEFPKLPAPEINIYADQEDPQCRFFNEPCDWVIEWRRADPDGISPPAVVRRYPQNPRSSTVWLFGKVQAPDGRLFATVSHGPSGSLMDIFEFDGDRWTPRVTNAARMRDPVWLDGALWLFRFEEGALRAARLVGDEIVPAGQALEGLGEQLFSTVQRDPHTGQVTAVVRDAEGIHWTFHDGEDWRPQSLMVIPAQWRGMPLGVWWPQFGGLALGGGARFFRLGSESLGEQQLMVPMVNGVASIDNAIQISQDHGIYVNETGRFVRVEVHNWNGEPAAWFARTLANQGCYDGRLCTEDRWLVNEARCAQIELDCLQDGNLCNGVEACNEETGECGPGEAVACDDNDPSNGVERCEPISGDCIAGAPPNVDDGFDCTRDRWADGVVNEPDDALCQIGGCTLSTCDPDHPDANRQTGCVHVRPEPGNAACLAVNGMCPDGLDRFGGDPCVADNDGDGLLDEDDACPLVPSTVDGGCDADGDPCTVGDTCVDGACVAGQPMDCSGLNDVCAEGRCVADGDAAVCVAAPIAEGEPCDDGEQCSQGDQCRDGRCHGEAFECPPATACEDAMSARCDGIGGCGYDPIADGTPCPGGFCDGGLCTVNSDECLTATTLTPDDRIALALQHATPSATDPACFDQAPQPDVWLRFEMAPGANYTVHARLLGGAGLKIGMTTACLGECVDSARLAQGAIAIGPMRAPANEARYLRLHAEPGDPNEVEVWLEIVADEAPCMAGSAGCDCRPDGGCDAELICANGVCGVPACPVGSAGCDCRPDSTCDGALICQGGQCVAAPGCEPGSVGCTCYGNGTCDAGLNCENDLCVEPPPCPDGSLDCPCYGNGTCDDGLRCSEGRCEGCPPGTDGCACYGNDTCDDGLQCTDDQCVPAASPMDATVMDAGTSMDMQLPADTGVNGSSADSGGCAVTTGEAPFCWWAFGIFGALILRRCR